FARLLRQFARLLRQDLVKLCQKVVKFLNVMVAAIDFGTTFSGFAFCTKSWYNYHGGPRIHIHPWPAQTTMTGKAPTCVLLDSDQNFISFGYEANTQFVEGKYDSEYCYFFKHFKMKLYEMKEELSRETMIESQNGKTMPAIKVFSAVIKFVKDTLLTYLKSKSPRSVFHASDIHWVLTVPAIWNLKAKQFMREAAQMAGIDDNQLTLALEPEAASLYCRQVPRSVDRTTGGRPSIANFKAGDKYLLMDLGGGTIDITAHEILENDHLKEIIEPTGGYWGSLRVNEEFTRFLQRLCGQDVLAELQANNPRRFIEGFDDPKKKRKHGRYSYVDDAFDRHVRKGDLVQYGKFQDGKDYHPLNNHQTQAWFDFYASDVRNPEFVNENSCVCLGFVGVELSPRQPELDATVTLAINISGTDIEVRATEKKTGNVTRAYCNFLG
ncbi:heat shock 70 kDa protein 12B-like, partial [Pecten maximus]|uniref:heat shock 70 kDa protein 12B-like n=1 Tax=Pecten maximus TaxID=6579 RepID=UPI00145817A5